uniref:Uncharacterized protein n=1 Tax=Terrapene triunguis TaxID=2587831 RepID=A0A674JQK8_9SAUR
MGEEVSVPAPGVLPPAYQTSAPSPCVGWARGLPGQSLPALGEAHWQQAPVLPQHRGQLPAITLLLTVLLLLVSHHTQLEELQDVLEKLQSKRISTWEKKYNQVPKCSIGQVCAVKKGARIGRLCDCPRGATCNTFLLKCL